MTKKDKTENIIKDKLDSREFAFDEKAWVGMENLLDAVEKRKKRAFFWYFSASMLVVLVAGGIYYYSQKVDNGNVTLSPSTTLRINSVEGQKASKTADFDKKVPVLTQSEASGTQSEASGTQSEVSGTQLEVSGTQSEASGTQSEVSGTQSELSGTQSEVSGTQSEVSGTQLEVSGTQLEVSGTQLEVSGTQSELSGTQSEVSGTQVEVKETAETTADSSKTAQKDSLSLAETSKNPLTAPGKETKNAWGVVAGAGYWFPYQSTLGATDRKGVIGFTGGIYYQRALSKRIELGLSVVYSSRGALNYDKTIINTEFGFGIESDKTTISPQTLHYITIPLYVRFNLSQRSHINIGAGYYQLLAVTSKITHTTENSFGVLESSSEKQTGDHPGFRKNDVSAFIGYEFTLFDRMNTGLQFSYGFYDITNNSYNNVKGNDRNISLQLQLKYDLIRH